MSQDSTPADLPFEMDMPRLVALRQALSAAAGGLLPPISPERMAMCFHRPALDPEVDRYMERLLQGDNATILLDLVMAGVCSFNDLACALRTWAPHEQATLSWAERNAALENGEIVPQIP